MTDKEVVNTLLDKESVITNRFHRAISEILRLGYDTERGRSEISDLIESVQYSLDELERVIDIQCNNKKK